jgi:hypothetical protein|tara:strand:- start:8308 stop:9225 length:918 start_codon:yes stop_codon:yes gene_type:complete
MNDNLWFNLSQAPPISAPLPAPISKAQAPVPVIAGLPAPGSTPIQVANDPGYLIPQPNGTSIDANGNVHIPMNIRVSKLLGENLTSKEGTTTGNNTKSLPKQYTILWDDGTQTHEYAADFTILGTAVGGCMDPASITYNPLANFQSATNPLGHPTCQYPDPEIPNNTQSGLTVPIFSIGEEVSFSDMSSCPEGGTIGPDHPCVVARWGTIMGMDESSIQPRYEIEMSDDGSTKYIEEEALSEFQPEGLEVGIVSPPISVPEVIQCTQEEYNIPLSKLGGDDKCVDKTLVVVLAAVALYFLLAKDK